MGGAVMSEQINCGLCGRDITARVEQGLFCECYLARICKQCGHDLDTRRDEGLGGMCLSCWSAVKANTERPKRPSELMRVVGGERD